MSTNFDDFPFYDDLIEKDSRVMSSIWMAALSSHIQTLNTYLTQYGIFAPQLTTIQRDQIQSPVKGQLIYNTTTDQFQGFQAGAWVAL